MSVNTNGLIYEASIHHALSQLLDDPYRIDAPIERNFSSFGYDLTFYKKDIPYHIEIKRNSKAQMGGTSLSYQNGSFTIVHEKHGHLSEFLEQDLAHMKPYVNEYLSFMEENNPLYDGPKLPMMIPVPIWEQAKDIGLLGNLNQNISHDVSFITNHYRSKGVFYIQIGNHGLYHMGENPLDLPIPELSGNVNLEIRLCRSGSKKRNVDGTEMKVAGANYRIQARLFDLQQSSYSLDHEDDIRTLF